MPARVRPAVAAILAGSEAPVPVTRAPRRRPRCGLDGGGLRWALRTREAGRAGGCRGSRAHACDGGSLGPIELLHHGEELWHLHGIRWTKVEWDAVRPSEANGLREHAHDLTVAEPNLEDVGTALRRRCDKRHDPLLVTDRALQQPSGGSVVLEPRS